MNRLDANLELVDVVECVEDTENVDSVLLGLIDELFNSIVGERGIGDTVGAAQQHLERNVGHQLPHLAQPVPRILVQEAESNIESSTTPALKRVQVVKSVAGLWGNVEEVDCPDTGGQKRLVGIAPGCVHKKAALVVAHSLGEGLGPLVEEELPPTILARLGDVKLGAIGLKETGLDDVALELGLADLTLDAATVDGNVTEVKQQLLGTVLAADEIEQLGGVIDEGCPAGSINEGGVRQEGCKEGNVGLDATDAELDQSTKHLSAGDFVGGTLASALDQHGVVVGSDDSSCEAVATIQTDTIAASRTVNLKLAGIRLEALGRIFGRDTALNGKASGRDAVLGQTKLLQSRTSGNLDLGRHDVDTSDLFSDSVLDLDTRVDLDEVVAVLLVDQELSGTRVAVVDGLGKLDRVGKDSIASLDGKVLGGGNLDNLLVAALNGAVTLKEMDDVAVVVTEQLDLDMLGLVKEALNEDSTVAESGLGLRGGTLEGLLQTLLVANHTHTATATTVGSLDDDGEAIFVGELLDLLKGADSTLGAGDDWNIGGNGELSGGDLVAKGIDDIGGRANELWWNPKLA